MQKQILRDARVLIVEDRPAQLDAFMQYLDEIDEDARTTCGIKSFQSSLASTVKEAEDFFEAADSPYDILILDLELPVRKNDAPRIDHGMRLLESVSKMKVKEVIIVSGFNEYDYVIKAVRKGAVDFIAKPYKRELLQARVLELWKRILEKDSSHLFEERIKELIPYAEHGFTYTFNSSFSNLVDLMTASADKIEKHAQQRYGLNRRESANNYLIRCLVEQQEALCRAKANLGNLQSNFLSSRLKKPEIVEMLLAGIRQIVEPCLFTKKVDLKIPMTGGTTILTFQDDVHAILKEIVVGALSELHDYSDNGNWIEVDVSITEGWVNVSFTDNLPSMNKDEVRRINDGDRVAADKRFSRAWGLSIMQNIASHDGGQLTVEKQNGQGNIITYRIPLAGS
jgi:DNA-binding response OmpR family regulator